MKKILIFILFLIQSYSFANTGLESNIYPYTMTSIDKNDMQVINIGIAAFYARIDMIRRATKTIDLEYFIYNPDSAGRIITKELIKAANRGVKVRLLVDKSAAVFKLDEYYAEILNKHNVEIRYYNAATIFQLSSIQFRNHRKLILIDGNEALTGGRNIADEYFNLSTTFNFLDRDIWVQGEIVRAMKDTFDLYWNSDIVEIPNKVIAPKRLVAIDDDFIRETSYQFELKKHHNKIKTANELIAYNEEDEKILDYTMDYGKTSLNTTGKYRCPEAIFATDREGGNFAERIHSKSYKQNFRLLRQVILKHMEKIEDEVILDSPYFLTDDNSRKEAKELLNSGKKITILTNSLNSTDAVYVSTVFSDTVKKIHTK